MNKPRWKGYKTFLGDVIERYVAYKRSIGRRFDVEHRTLRLLDEFIAGGELYSTVFALLYALGLRAGEATNLAVGDVDLERKLLLIRHAKFRKTRLVPFGPNVERLLRGFLDVRRCRGDLLLAEDPVFTFGGGRPICSNHTSSIFRDLVKSLGLGGREARTRPRLHDLRHSFAISTLLRWYRHDRNPGSHLLELSTFMGHSSPSSTAIYLTMTVELLREAGRRYSRFAKPSPLQEITT